MSLEGRLQLSFSPSVGSSDSIDLRNCYDYAPRFRGVLGQFMGACDLIQRHNLRDVESLPARLKRPIDLLCRFDLCLGLHIVAAYEE